MTIYTIRHGETMRETCDRTQDFLKDGTAKLIEQDHIWYDKSRRVDHYSIDRFQ